MSIENSPFGPVVLSGYDAVRFRQHMNENEPKQEVKDALERGRNILESLNAQTQEECPESPSLGKIIVLSGNAGIGLGGIIIEVAELAHVSLDDIAQAVKSMSRNEREESLSSLRDELELVRLDHMCQVSVKPDRKETPANYIHKPDKRAIYRRKK